MPDTPPVGEREAVEALEPYCEKIRDALSLEFLDEFMEAYHTMWRAAIDDAFVRGFRMGAGLARELEWSGGDG